MNRSLMNLKYLAVFLLAIVFLLLVSFDAFSQSEIDLGAIGDTTTMKTSKEIMREVVSYEPYDSTCTREVADGTRNVCSAGRTERRCRKISGVGEECWDVTEEVCSDETVYRTETYSCTEYRRVVDYVYDHSVNATVDVVKTLRSKNYDLNNCKFGVNLADTAETYYARCMEAIVKVNVVSRHETMNGANKERTIKLDLDFFDISGLNALKNGLADLSFSKGIVTFVTSDLEGLTNFKMNLKLTRNRLLLKDKVVFNRELKASDMTIAKLEGGKAKVSVNLAKIGASIDSTKKHTLNLGLSALKPVDVKGSINTPKLENSLSSSIVIND